MISDLKNDGFHICLWQLPYFTPKNRLFPEIVEKGLAVKDGKGNLPYEDAVLDFSHPEAVKWYQEKLGDLVRQGVGAIKVDFGEAAPVNGLYASGRIGFYEHNLYPLRYNKAAAEAIKNVSGENIIWARSAWAGSQRYPLHWGGRRRSYRRGNGRRIARRTFVWFERIRFLEPRHRRIHHAIAGRVVSPLAPLRHARLA